MKHIILSLSLLTLLNCTSNPPQKETIITAAKQQDGEKHTEFYPNGQLKIEGHLINQNRQGKWISYYENGEIWSEANYLDGKKNGQTKSFYTNNNLRFLGHYEDDKKTGQWFFYNENGQFEKEVDFSNE